MCNFKALPGLCGAPRLWRRVAIRKRKLLGDEPVEAEANARPS
jgi:hypothetical protein